VSTWTERRLTLGTLDTTLSSGAQLRLELSSPDRDLWVAMSGDRPSNLEITH
jgi:hypothetical protein